MDNGYTIDHHVECGKLITLFSAPDYPQFQVILCHMIFRHLENNLLLLKHYTVYEFHK